VYCNVSNLIPSQKFWYRTSVSLITVHVHKIYVTLIESQIVQYWERIICSCIEKSQSGAINLGALTEEIVSFQRQTNLSKPSKLDQPT
jgi:flagellar biosynthesis/type III secretory pathway chaperone